MTPEEIIRGGRLPTKSVPICLHADLVADHERLERELEKALSQPYDGLEAGGQARVISEQIKALEAEMLAHTVEFKLQALPRRAYNDLVAKHPAEDSDRMLFNPDTFFPALIRACTVEPQLSDEVWQLLLDEKLTDQQFDTLADAAVGLNRRDVDVPLSRRASRVMQDAGPESKPQNVSA